MTIAHIKKITKSGVKQTIGIVSRPISQFFLARIKGLTVFVFHDVTNNPSPFALQYGLYVSIETFQQQVLWISRNFDVIHPLDLLQKTSFPSRAAIITFDDGFSGAFKDGLNILRKHKLPSLLFLNMRAILENRPLLSAIACYLDRFVPEFNYFVKSMGILRPTHLTISPNILCLYEERFGYINLKEVLDYQGSFADLKIIRKWDCQDLVVYGNHLYEHWNAQALNIDEFQEQYQKNKVALSQLKNSVDFFAFPNGHPSSCFSKNHIELLTQLGALRVFSASGGLNRDANKYLLGRMSLSEPYNEHHLWFRIFKSLLAR